MGEDRAKGPGCLAGGHPRPDLLRQRTCGLTTSPRTSCCSWPFVPGFVGGPDEGALGRLRRRAAERPVPAEHAVRVVGPGRLPGRLRRRLGEDELPAPAFVAGPGVAAAGTALGVVLFVAIGYVVGQAQLVAPGKNGSPWWPSSRPRTPRCSRCRRRCLMGWALGSRSATPQSLPSPREALLNQPSRRRGGARSRRRRRVQARVR